MSFQAYLENIKAKTGKSPDDFVRLAGRKGLLGADVKAGQVLEWLREDFGLARGHGMAVVVVLRDATRPKPSSGDGVAAHFSGRQERWQAPFERLRSEMESFGPAITVRAGGSYLSLLRDGRKFGIVQVSGGRLDVGINLKGPAPSARFEPAGTWNSMVTHRVRITDPVQIDQELITELRRAFERAGDGRRAGGRS